MFYSTSYSGIIIRDAENGVCLDTLSGFLDFRFSFDNKCIIGPRSDTIVSIINANTGGLMCDIIWLEASCEYYFSPDYKRIILCGEKKCCLYDMETGSQIAVFEGDNVAVFSPDGKTIVTEYQRENAKYYDGAYHGTISFSDNADIRLWDSSTGNCIDTLKGCKASYTPDGESISAFVVDASVNNGIFAMSVGINLYHATTGNIVASLETENEMVTSIVYSPTGNHLVTKGSNITLWDAKNGNRIGCFKGYDAFFDPDGECLVVISSSKEERSPHKKERISSSNSFTQSVLKNIGVYEEDSQLDVNFNWENYNMVYVIEAESGKIKYTFEGDEVFFSPDGKYILSQRSIKSSMLSAAGLLQNEKDVNLNVFLRDVKTGAIITCMKGSGAKFSPDNKRVLTQSDNFMYIYDVETGLCVYDGIAAQAYKPKFSPDGNIVVFTSYDSYNLYQIQIPPLQDLIDQTRERFKDRPLTPEERHQYYLE